MTFEYYGAVTSEDIIESNQAVYGDKRFDELRWQVVVFTESCSIAFKPHSIRLIAYMDQAAARSNPYINVAFVATSEIALEVENAYRSEGSEPPWPVMQFESSQEAYAYIEQKEGAPLSE